ncbi:MAG: metalloregulator ArsR/SmtB family transcription factor [Deltaproteobacteria bacterium]|nr:metalloregulator ArsR/SmtB family transcription factor [Deltaproteobacteria bacterium]
MKQTARFFKTLANETRLRILALLTSGELCVCDLMAALDLPQSTVSRHLATLRNSGLVEDRRQGVWMYYRLAQGGETALNKLLPLLQSQLAELPEVQQDLASLENYLKQKDIAACE